MITGQQTPDSGNLVVGGSVEAMNYVYDYVCTCTYILCICTYILSTSSPPCRFRMIAGLQTPDSGNLLVGGSVVEPQYCCAAELEFVCIFEGFWRGLGRTHDRKVRTAQ